MLSPDRRHRNIMIIITILIISIGVFFIQRAFRDGFGLVSIVARPVEGLLSGGGAAVHDFWGSISRISTVSQENKSLQEKNRKLEAELEQAKVFREENISLRQLLELNISARGEGLAAEIIARDPTNWFERFTINRGKSKGINKNMIIQTPEGLAGQITQLDDNTATVRTILNPRSAVPVYIVESGTFGILVGDSSPICTIKFIRNINFMQEGHLVVTSGMGDIFPPGILVGRITTVQGSVDSLSSRAKVKPFVNFEKLRFVMVTRGKN